MFHRGSLGGQPLCFPVLFQLCFPVRLGDMHWVSYNSACSVCGELALLFLCIVVGNGLFACFVALALGYGFEESRGIVSVHDWESHLGRELCLVPAYR